MKVKLCCFLIPLIMIACKIDENGNVKGQSGVQKTTQQKTAQKRTYGVKSLRDKNVPNACTLVSKQDIAKVFNISPDIINVKDGNPAGKESRGCFYRWEDNGLPNAGVLVQVLKNTRPDDLENWPSRFIDSRIENGEGGTDTAPLVKYSNWTDVGTTGAYSHQLAKYYFQLDDEVVFMVAFNMNSEPKQQMAVANLISQRILQNFLKKHNK